MFFAQRSFIYPAPEQAAQVPVGFEEIRFTAADGQTVSGVYRPALASKPTIVFFHGNGDGWDGGVRATAVLAEAGYGVFLPEYRGYGGNSGSPSEDGLYQDGRAALAWLVMQGVERDEQVLIGNSLGTGVATQMATETPPAALILVSPFASMPDVVAEKVRWLPARLLVRDRFENAAKIHQVRAPILLLHGQNDRLIKFSHSERLARAAKQAELVAFAGVGHELAYLDEAGHAELAWLEKQP